MPSMLRRAIGAVKDQASIGIARLSAASMSELEVAILKATSRDDTPPTESQVADVLVATLSAQSGEAACVQLLARRMSRTRTWTVALKALLLAYRCMCDGGARFWREASALASPTGGSHLFNVSSFSDTSSATSPWDYTAFVRTFARYLDARLALASAGKLHNLHRRNLHASFVSSMEVPDVLEHVRHWQRLLNAAVGTRPTGPARFRSLVRASLHVVVRESFDLHRDVSSGLLLLLDNFFQQPHKLRVETFDVCTVVVKQFKELEAFYALCKKLGIGRVSEYPSVQTISATLVTTLEDFLVDGRPSQGSLPPELALQASTPSSECREGGPSISSTVSAPDAPPDKHTAARRRQETSAPVNTSSNTKTPTTAKSDRKASTEWELLLAESAKIMSDHYSDRNEERQLLLAGNADAVRNNGGGQHVYGRRQIQWGAQGQQSSIMSYHLRNRNINRTKEHHQEYRNPFLQDCNQRGMEMVPWQTAEVAPPPPTFQAGRASEATAPRGTNPFDAEETVGLPADAPTRQLLLLREQQKWIEQQRKIFEKNKPAL